MNGINKDPFACKLACHLVQAQFGDICETTCCCLLDRGMLSAFDLVRSTGFKPSQLHSALLVLIQHNFVNCYLQIEETNPRRPPISQTLYEADLPAILQNLRKPSLLVHIRDESAGPAVAGEEADQSLSAGEVNEALMKMLLEQGRLNLDQVIAAAAQNLEQPVEEARELLQRHFLGLVQKRYIERAPGCHEPPPVPFQHRKGNRKSAPKPGTAEEARHQAQQAKALARAEYEKERFKLPSSLMQAARDDGAGPEPPKKKHRMGGSTATGPVKEEDDKEKVVLWRVNRDEFNKRLRHAACIDMVQQKNGPDAAAILRAMLHATQSYETESKAPQSKSVSQDEVISFVRELEAIDPDYHPPDAVADVLRELSDDALQPVSYTGEGPGGSTYCVNMAAIIRHKRLLETDAVIRQRFGVHGLRLFRLLYLHRQLEQKQIAEQAMLPPKDAKELLYRLYRAGFVSLQDVPRTTDHAPSRTLYTWRVEIDAAADKLASELYKAALNVCLRLDFEYQRQKDILELVNKGMAQAVQRTHGKQLQKFQQTLIHLDSALLRLDSQIAVFNDF
ncbi:hypothetical protein WJX79_001083 [Trebouxia sp. C0005]